MIKFNKKLLVPISIIFLMPFIFSISFGYNTLSPPQGDIYRNITEIINNNHFDGNSSWNQTFADTLYSSIIWSYNQSLNVPDDSLTLNIENITNFLYNYNQTFETNKTMYETYGEFWYNMSDGVGDGNSSWNQTFADTLYSSIIWSYNQSLNVPDDSLTLNIENITNFLYNYNQTFETNKTMYETYGEFWYNMSDGVGDGNSSWNQTFADTLYSDIQWNYNQSDGSYNETYDKWAYNQTVNNNNIFNQDLNTTNNVKFNELNITENSYFNYTFEISSGESALKIQEIVVGSIETVGWEAKAGIIYGMPQDPLEYGLGIANNFALVDTNHNGSVSLIGVKQNMSKIMKLKFDLSNSQYVFDEDVNTSGNLYTNEVLVNEWLYNMSDGSYNETYHEFAYNQTDTKYYYNQSDGSYNETYDKWAYNMSDGAYNQSYLTSINNIFDQDLNTTSDVRFNNFTAGGLNISRDLLEFTLEQHTFNLSLLAPDFYLTAPVASGRLDDSLATGAFGEYAFGSYGSFFIIDKDDRGEVGFAFTKNELLDGSAAINYDFEEVYFYFEGGDVVPSLVDYEDEIYYNLGQDGLEWNTLWLRENLCLGGNCIGSWDDVGDGSYNSSYLTSINNIFNQDLNTTSNVTFNNLSITGNSLFNYESKFFSSDSSLEIKEYGLGEVGSEENAGLIVGTNEGSLGSGVGLSDNIYLVDTSSNGQVIISGTRQDLATNLQITFDLINSLFQFNDKVEFENNVEITGILNISNGGKLYSNETCFTQDCSVRQYYNGSSLITQVN
jgi:hypothetical protein